MSAETAIAVDVDAMGASLEQKENAILNALKSAFLQTTGQVG